ncbi:Uncharacterised protein [Streptomyces griseus]|nr:hypothetical protein SAMN04490359_6933 [Streptomyces griseus]SQA21102.1 Uncharacterised protein [Streptomyces griseus]
MGRCRPRHHGVATADARPDAPARHVRCRRRPEGPAGTASDSDGNTGVTGKTGVIGETGVTGEFGVTGLSAMTGISARIPGDQLNIACMVSWDAVFCWSFSLPQQVLRMMRVRSAFSGIVRCRVVSDRRKYISPVACG